jgi:hypothetical protein
MQRNGPPLEIPRRDANVGHLPHQIYVACDTDCGRAGKRANCIPRSSLIEEEMAQSPLLRCYVFSENAVELVIPLKEHEEYKIHILVFH